MNLMQSQSLRSGFPILQVSKVKPERKQMGSSLPRLAGRLRHGDLGLTHEPDLKDISKLIC